MDTFDGLSPSTTYFVNVNGIEGVQHHESVELPCLPLSVGHVTKDNLILRQKLVFFLSL